MQNAAPLNLERALARTESDADAALKAADTAVKALRKVRAAARDGNLRDLRASLEAAEQALNALRQQFANARQGWDFDEERYFAEGRLPQELIAEAERIGVRIFEQDERLYCYPALIRVAPSDRAVLVDKKLVRAVRPSALAQRLRDLQRKPARSRPGPMLRALYNAYKKAAATRGKDALAAAPVIPLIEIYELLTLMPGQDYSRQEFARDLYLLDQSGEEIVPGQARLTFIRERENFARNRISMVAPDGTERAYYAVSFRPLG